MFVPNVPRPTIPAHLARFVGHTTDVLVSGTFTRPVVLGLDEDGEEEIDEEEVTVWGWADERGEAASALVFVIRGATRDHAFFSEADFVKAYAVIGDAALEAFEAERQDRARL